MMIEEQDIKEYKSPVRKLIKFFKKSRDLWKRKYQEVKATVKYLQNRTRFLEKSKENLKNRVKELEYELVSDHLLLWTLYTDTKMTPLINHKPKML